jgi:hypothetical protein
VFDSRQVTQTEAAVAGFIENFKRGLAGDDTQHYRVAGVPVRCAHCGGKKFDSGTALLNSSGMTFLGLDWANRSANLLICTKCSHINWFLQQPEEV